MARNYVTTVAVHADTHVFRARGINGHGASLINTPPLAVTRGCIAWNRLHYSFYARAILALLYI